MAKLVLSSVVYVCLLYASCNREMQGEVGDKTSHKVQFIQVQPGVKLEVLDYGGSGRAMVFLAALGQNAHDWDRFAPKFVSRYHVYAITRRGFGNSDKPKPTVECMAMVAPRYSGFALNVMPDVRAPESAGMAMA